ncbi:DUF499 domain-containing protein [Infirmifilum sp.]|uniref:DUF499 domain-containing protein n=1 Tax=Infirmifilum sp. TaxID=2856575 RepID=UPI003D130C4C
MRKLKIRDEVESLKYEPAVDLGDVVKGRAPPFIQDPVEFFKRTHLTESMKTLVVKVIMNLIGLKEASVGGKRFVATSNLILLPSDLGGGKTHSLILLYHVFNLIRESRSKDDAVSKLKMLDSDIAGFVNEHWDLIRSPPPNLVFIDCKYSDLAPSPAKPIEIGGRKIKTIWGYLGHVLGRYDAVRSSDEKEIAPYADDLQKVLNGSRAVVLIDEIGRYYDQSGLQPTSISTFLMNLAEALSKYNVREVAVVITMPYEIRGGTVEAKPGMEYIHRGELVKAVSDVLSRTNVEVIKPVSERELAEILRKRIFAYDREELDKMASEFSSSEVIREYPEYVKNILQRRGFWGEVRKTYPFHPMFLELIEKLAYRLPHLQRTRDAIKIAVQAVLALREGLFDAIEDEVGLVMPYHIPVFVREVLDETILRSPPDEYNVFRLVLKENVADPESFDNIKKLGKEGFYEKVVARNLRDLGQERGGVGFKLASIIWLHSLVGLGLPMNLGLYPTTQDLIYSVSPTDQDVKSTLLILRSVLPQLIVHGDPESDSARWFFTNIPSIEELVEMLKKNVTDEMVKEKLRELLESGLSGKRGRGRPPKGYKKDSIFNATVAKNIESVSKDYLESRDPVLVILADRVSKDELLGFLQGRNNIVVLAPHVDGIGEAKGIAPEDIAGIRELAGLKGKTVWEGLIEILKYYIAAGSIGEDHLKAMVGEISDKREGGYIRDLLGLLKEKVENKKEYYERHTWTMISRCYRRVYYHRQGEVRFEEGLSLESDEPIPVVVEEFLRDKGLIPQEFTKDSILSLVRDYLGKNPEEEPIKVGSLWSFITTTDKANTPIIRYRDFIEAVKDLIKTMDYAIRVGGTLVWKPIFSSREEAKSSREGEKVLEKVEELLERLKISWDEVELVYWEKVFDEWLNKVYESLPSNKVVKVEDRSGRVLDIRDINLDLKNTVKAGKLFYEEKKYLVDFTPKLPDRVLEGREYEVEASIDVKNFEEEIQVKLKPDEGLTVEPREFGGKPPLSIRFKIKADKPGNYSITADVYGRGSILDSRAISVQVIGEWIEEEIAIDAKDGGKPIGDDAKVVSIVVREIASLPDIARIMRSHRGTVTGSIVIDSETAKINIRVETEDGAVLDQLHSTIINISRNLGAKAVIETTYTPKSELVYREIANYIVNKEGVRLKIKKRANMG